ncbi:MAG: hypothetical protein UR61_C0057G0003 [candidate division WS6 bacterium GW2011_GWE1_34_7]|uniref:Uncharacterized protein n=1 Tax=candidate division WS6 bacterium GW2011_GWE1_34_7 TaxID=1619093 RepID=A0A0G0E9D5_9BACT|nr:MAG: hypothetical protein UR61_C0057G0003 [candidate division WS6 bacterium GW2011_GWE1_34_7]
MGDTDIEFLTKPEEYLAISTPDQLVDEYPQHFEKTQLINEQITFERSCNNRGGTETERFFCTSRTICTISSDGKYDIWDLNMTDPQVLTSIAIKVNGLRIRNQDTKTNRTETTEIAGYDRKVKVTYLPPTKENSDYIIETLNRRRELLQK